MIKKIKINNVPPYLCGEQVIEAKHINFLFGLNGSGKTTISRYLSTQDKPSYANCSIEWKNAPIKIAVYNRDYVKNNFSESSIPGIFTLGEENIDIQKKIDDYEDKIKDLTERRLELQNELEGSNDNTGLYTQLTNLESAYSDKFWSIKQKLDKEQSPLRPAIEGVRSSKDNFKKRILSENSLNKSELLERSELERLCSQLYGNNVEKQQLLGIPSFDRLLTLEKDEILQKVIVGKDDVDISRLIKKLGNDSWFRQGASYAENSEGLCPFCQRPLEQDFFNKVSEYFDESYLAAVQDIDRINNDYCRIAEDLTSRIKAVIDNPFDFADVDKLKEAYRQFFNIVDVNERKLLEKKTSPNIIVQLESIAGVASSIIQIIKDANAAITEHNERIDHIKDERNTLTSKVWRYILSVLEDDISNFLEKERELKQSIEKAREEINAITQEINTKTQEQHLLEQKLTSVLPTANGINAFLKNYGVTGFTLDVNEKDKTYQFIRENGTPALESLSEGERNFVTFLYFIYSLHGNTDESGHNDDKIVVVDDPVSSLDSDVLFVVASLLRDTFQKIYAEDGAIKQLFILSHNSFFFKEVSYKQGISKKKTGYWMIAKENNMSRITEYPENPVNSTYEMLWDEVRKAKSNPTGSNTMSLANTMRRIIEHYFSLLGGIDLSRLHLNYPEGERQVFKSLISWANAGSHSAFDDYSATPNLYNSEKYLEVFGDLFEKAGHKAHYDMMMKGTTEE